MPQSITQAFVVQWDTQIKLLAQQQDSRLWGSLTDRGSITGESFTTNLLAAIEDTPENTVRHGDTTWSDAIHTTRVALMQDFYQALPVDRNDEPKLLANPLSGSYNASLMAAWNRRKDKIAYRALVGNAQAKDGTIITLPSSQKIVAGGTGFTKAKLITARKIFRKNEADNHNGETLNIVYTSEMLEDILSDTTLTSADFLAVQMLQKGDVTGNWMGFNWIPYEGIDVSAGTYTTVAFAKSAVQTGTGFVEGKASRRPDKKDLMQVSMAGSVGAARTEETKVVTIDFV